MPLNETGAVFLEASGQPETNKLCMCGYINRYSYGNMYVHIYMYYIYIYIYIYTRTSEISSKVTGTARLEASPSSRRTSYRSAARDSICHTHKTKSNGRFRLRVFFGKLENDSLSHKKKKKRVRIRVNPINRNKHQSAARDSICHTQNKRKSDQNVRLGFGFPPTNWSLTPCQK